MENAKKSWKARLAVTGVALAAAAGGVAATAVPAQAHWPACETSAWYTSPYPGNIQSTGQVNHCRSFNVNGVTYGKASLEHVVYQHRPGDPNAYLVHYRYVTGNRHSASDTSGWIACPAGYVYSTRATAFYKHHGSWTNEGSAYNEFHCF